MKLKILIIAIIIIGCNSATMASDNQINEKNDFSIWQQINQDGFGSKLNVGPRGVEIFNNSLISGTANYKISEWGMSFDDPLRFRDFINILYKGNDDSYKDMTSNGLEIFAYNNTSVNQLIGENGILPSGFGDPNNSEVGVIIEFKGYLYAGIRNSKEGCQVWRTKNIDETWEQVVTNGFGNKDNTWAMEAEIFNDYLYMGTMNWNGCELFRTQDGITWESVIGGESNTKAGFGQTDIYVWSMEVYNNHLYLGTQYGTIWRSADGIIWEPVVAYNNRLASKLKGAYYPEGFKKIFYRTGGIRNMLVYNDELYIFTAGGYAVDFKLSNFGKIFSYRTDSLWSRLLFRSAIQGAEIWKFNSTMDKWMRVIGKKGTDISNRGFGDSENTYFWCVEIYNNSLYVGTMHVNPFSLTIGREGILHWDITFDCPKGHGELWKFNGDVWEKIVGEESSCEFNDGYNFGIREIKSYKNSLYLYTFNVKTGCELWEYKP